MLKFLIFCLVFVQIISCKHNDINLQAMRGTSELIHARLCYGNNAKKLYEENEILIQTGLIDTTDEQPPIDAAIIKIDNKEIILTKMKETKSGNLNIKEYAGEQYHLTITDSEKKEDNETMYESDCIVTIGNLKSEYKLTGRYNLGL